MSCAACDSLKPRNKTCWRHPAEPELVEKPMRLQKLPNPGSHVLPGGGSLQHPASPLVLPKAVASLPLLTVGTWIQQGANRWEIVAVVPLPHSTRQPFARYDLTRLSGVGNGLGIAYHDEVEAGTYIVVSGATVTTPAPTTGVGSYPLPIGTVLGVPGGNHFWTIEKVHPIVHDAYSCRSSSSSTTGIIYHDEIVRGVYTVPPGSVPTPQPAAIRAPAMLVVSHPLAKGTRLWQVAKQVVWEVQHIVGGQLGGVLYSVVSPGNPNPASRLYVPSYDIDSGDYVALVPTGTVLPQGTRVQQVGSAIVWVIQAHLANGWYEAEVDPSCVNLVRFTMMRISPNAFEAPPPSSQIPPWHVVA